MKNQRISTWIITEGLAGTENQCLGVAEALGIAALPLRVSLRQPWKSLSPFLGFEQSWTFTPGLPGPPWPDLLIASGRKSIAASRYIKKASGRKTFTVQIQDPRIDPKHFDLVAVPAHDPARGDNVIVTAGAPNSITEKKLESAKKLFPDFARIKSPRIAVLIGGSSKAYTLTPDILLKLINDLENLDAGLMVTASRRTGEQNIELLKKTCARENCYFWNGAGDNPYFALLAWADYIIVTADSTSMISESLTTGKPVCVVPLEGGSRRSSAFLDNLHRQGMIRYFEGTLEPWTYTPLNDSGRIALEIRQRLKNSAS